MVTTVRTSDRGTAAEVPPSAVAFVLDRDSEGVMRRCFADLGIADAQVSRGGIDTAIEDIGRRGSPQLLVVDVSGVNDPIIMISRLAEVCDPRTEVVVVGERNDIVLYRELKDSGVAEYFFKPLVSSVLVRSLGDAASGEVNRRSARTGKLILVLGVHGGVGTTTVAVQTAWHLAEARERRVLLLDLNLQTGDAALQLDTAPSHALREAFEHPERIDDLFLERGVAKVTPRLGLLAALEPLTEHIMPAEEAALQLLAELLRRYRYVIVDFPCAGGPRIPESAALAEHGSPGEQREPRLGPGSGALARDDRRQHAGALDIARPQQKRRRRRPAGRRAQARVRVTPRHHHPL